MVTVVNPLAARSRGAPCAWRASFAGTASPGERRVDGKSILGLLLLAAARGTALEISADGEDADARWRPGGLVERDSKTYETLTTRRVGRYRRRRAVVAVRRRASPLPGRRQRRDREPRFRPRGRTRVLERSGAGHPTAGAARAAIFAAQLLMRPAAGVAHRRADQAERINATGVERF
jgi:phosphocarrier protein